MRLLTAAFGLALLAGSLGVSPAAHAQRTSASPADSAALGRVSAAFQAGDVEAILSHAADPLDLAIFGQGAAYSRSQAALVLTDFFRKHPPTEVGFEQEVVAEDRRSVVGWYRTAAWPEPATVSVRFRARGNRWVIRSVRIEGRRRR